MSDDGVTVQAAPAPEEEMEEDKVEIEALSTEERSSAVGEDEKSESVVGGEDDGDEEESKSSHQADNDSPKASSSTDAAADEKKNSTVPPSSRRGRAPAVKGLTIPFRTVKKVSFGVFVAPSDHGDLQHVTNKFSSGNETRPRYSNSAE